MNVTCNDRDRIFEDGTPAEWAALEAHAAACPVCAEELNAWKSLSLAAVELRDYSDTPSLWPRIQRSLAEASLVDPAGDLHPHWQSFWNSLRTPLSQAAAAGILVVALAVSGFFYLHRQRSPLPGEHDLLKTQALNDVERAESAYVQAIDKLAAQAQPQLGRTETPLLTSYREKLLVLDSAIGDLRTQAGQNPSNAHLRYELLAMYQEKQRTLEEILEEKR